MSVPATEYWFSVSKRRNRKSFMIAFALMWAILALLVLALLFFEPSRSNALLIIAVFSVPAFACHYTLTAQRLRDLNLTGWLALLWIPIGIADRSFLGGAGWLTFTIILCAMPGTAGPNNYGEDPLV